MKTIGIDDLRRRALATGFEVEVAGAKFNTAREQVSVAPASQPTPAAPPAALVAPAPPPDPGVTRAEVAAMVAERDAVWRQQIDHLTQAFGAALQSLRQPAQKAGATHRVVRFEMTYDDDKCLTGIVPVYAH